MTLELLLKSKEKLFVLVFLLFSCFVAAQDSDPILQSYQLAYENLSESVSVFSNDSQQSIEALGDASQMLRPLSNGSNGDVIAALERTFERSKTAVQNQSTTDLAVQVAVLQGGFWRLVYEAAVQSSNDGNLELAKQRLANIAQDMGVAETNVTAIQESTTALAMLSQLESGVASVVKARLDQAGQLLEDKNASYVELAKAYSLYLPIQDSPRADPVIGNQFTEAFTALIASQTDTLANLLNRMSTLMEQFATSATTQLSDAAEAESSPTQTTIETAAPPAESSETETTPIETTNLETDVAETPISTPTLAETTNSETSETDEASTATQTATNVIAAPGSEAEVSVINQELQRQLSRLGLPQRQQDRLGELYQTQGYNNLEAVADKLYAGSAKLSAALAQADQNRAKTLVSEYQSSYQSLAAPILEQINPELHTQNQNLVNRLLAAPNLRLQEAAVLAQQTDAVASLLTTGSASSNPQLESLTTGVWAGWLRTALIMLLGLLAFVPLYLLYLAFGGGNRNWQLVGWALFFLLLPLIYEGLSHLLGLASFIAGGLPILDKLAQFSIFQSTLSQIIWVTTTAAAIALASLGLYGICVQFGLLGQKNQATQANTLADTQANSSTVNASTFDWDEEF